ncbi:MAG: RNA-binding domain-containing protein [Polaribacter sp.]
MTKEEILYSIQQGENETTEFKKSAKALPASLWESYAALANTNGGVILLGVSEKDNKFSITGVHNPQKLVTDFWNQVNNTQKVNINVLFNNHLNVVEVDDKVVIVIKIPQTTRQERPVYINNNLFKGTFRRNADGDYHCSENEIKGMLRDQSEIPADHTTFSEVKIDEIKTDTFRRYRNRFKNLKPQHIWNNLGDDEFLLKLGAVKRINNVIEVTLAGIVLFAEDSIITNVLPSYFLDYREKSEEKNLRWNDRVYSNSGTWSGNIYDFYFIIADKIVKSIKLPFILKGMDRMDTNPFHESVREAVANAIIHTDYHERRGVVIEKYEDTLMLSNPGNFRISFSVANQGGISDPRNASIFKILSLVGIGERAGSGISSINYIFAEYNLQVPEFKETFNPSRTHLKLSWNKVQKSSVENSEKFGRNEKSSVENSEKFGRNEKSSVESSEKFGRNEKSSVKTEYRILEILKKNQKITIPKLSKELNISTRAIEKQLEKLKTQKRLERIGATKGGYWKIIKEKV